MSRVYSETAEVHIPKFSLFRHQTVPGCVDVRHLKYLSFMVKNACKAVLKKSSFIFVFEKIHASITKVIELNNFL